MEGKIEVFDNFLSKEDFTKIKELPLKLDWKFYDHKVDTLDGHCQFVHLFYNKNDTDKKSSFYNLLSPLIDKMNIKVLTRIKANLTLKSNSIVQYVDESNILWTLGSFVNKDNNNGATTD